MPTDHSDLQWRTSSLSMKEADCVEVAEAGSSTAVRDSKDPAGPLLAFAHDEWAAFLGAVKAGALRR